MSTTTADLRAIAAGRPAFGPSLARQVRHWLGQRHQAAVLRLVEPRLREDAGLAAAPPAAPRLPSLTMLGGG